MIIRDAAKATGVTEKAIRFYEKQGLFKLDRQGNNYRGFDEDDLDTLRFIKVAREIGFTVKEIKVLLMPFQDKELSDEAAMAAAAQCQLMVGDKVDKLAFLFKAIGDFKLTLSQGIRLDAPVLPAEAAE